MTWRIVRLVIRLAGWLLTPLIIILAAAIGAYLAALVAPRFSTKTGLIIVVLAGLTGSVLGIRLWMKLLRRNPELRHALAVTQGGVPEGKAVGELFESERPAAGDGPS